MSKLFAGDLGLVLKVCFFNNCNVSCNFVLRYDSFQFVYFSRVSNRSHLLHCTCIHSF